MSPRKGKINNSQIFTGSSIIADLSMAGRTSHTGCDATRIVGLKRHFVAAGLVPDVGFLRVNEADSFFKGTRSLDPNRETLNHSAGHEKLLMLTHLISEETPSLRLPTRNSKEPNMRHYPLTQISFRPIISNQDT